MPKDTPATDAAARNENIEADFCVIGAGPGGLSFAAAAAAYGQRVVLVEKQKMGGDGLHYGSVPSKALLAAAKRAHAMRTASPFGIRGVEPLIDHRAVQEHVKDVIARIAPNAAAERFAGLGVRVIASAARFVDRSTVVAGDYRISARRFVIATGSSPVIPAIPGLADVAYFTNETIFDNAVPLPHLIIIGAGSTGLELAQAHRRLGSRVTVLDAALALGNEDPELAVVLLTRLHNEGIAIREGIRIRRVAGGQGQITVEIESPDGVETIEGSDLLIAAGRKANVADLGLQAAGISFTSSGIKVNAGLRTRNRRVYAIGDAAGGPQYSHMASEHAGIVLRRTLFRLGAKTTDCAVPKSFLRIPNWPVSASTNPRCALSPARSTCCVGRTMRTTGRRRSARRTATSRSLRRRRVTSLASRLSGPTPARLFRCGRSPSRRASRSGP